MKKEMTRREVMLHEMFKAQAFEEPKDPSPIARWQTKGHDWLELYRDARNYAPDKGRFSYSYKGNGCGGGFVANSDEEAISRMENPWGHPEGAGQAFVLKCDRPSLKRVFPRSI